MGDAYLTAELAALSAGEYVAALQSIQLHQHDREMLVTNYHAPERTITARQMASALGFGSYGVSNLHYGGLAKRIGDKVEIHPAHAELWLLITMSWPDGECKWTLRPQVAAALESLGWVRGFGGALPEEAWGELLEGAAYRVLVSAYERNPVARERCVRHHGASCVICGFNFGKVYGPLVLQR